MLVKNQCQRSRGVDVLTCNTQVHSVHTQSIGLPNNDSNVQMGYRFMAEVPGAHAKRVQALLAWLLQCQGGSALPFLLPGLLLCIQPDADSLASDEPGTDKRWQRALTEPQASASCWSCLCCRLHNQADLAVSMNAGKFWFQCCSKIGFAT